MDEAQQRRTYNAQGFTKDPTEHLLVLANHAVEYDEEQLKTPGGQWLLTRLVDAWLYSGLQAL
jgi:hypothetical protein